MTGQWLSRSTLLLLLVVASMAASGCELVGDIFKAGVWVGVVMVVFVIALIGFIATKMRA